MKYLAVVQHYWGSGETREEAERNVERESGKVFAAYKTRVLYRVADNFKVSEVDGSVSAKTGEVVERYVKGIKQ